MTDAASILFPNDVPVPRQQTPSAAKARPSSSPRDDAAARLFPNEGKADTAPLSAGANDDPASVLFKDQAKADYDSVMTGELDHYTLGAIKDGDADRAGALRGAKSALTEDFRSAGTPSEDIKSAFEIIREHDHSLSPPSAEQIEADFEAGMATLQAELGSSMQSDLGAARAFINDLEKVAPGTIASLERFGAGNDPRLIRAAIKEAKRRGYR